MLRFNATRYLNMGGLIADMTGHFGLREGSKNEAERSRHDDEFRRDLGRIFKLANELNLKTTAQLIEPRLKDLPQSEGEYDLLIECLYNELNNRLFLYVPSHRSEFYESDILIALSAKIAFPTADAELRLAGNCYAAGAPTACAYHCMRALETGLNALAAEVGVKPGVQNWQPIIDQIEAAIKTEGQRLPAGAVKAARLQFLSEAAKEFSHFKDGWRNHIAHNRSAYGESQALTVLNHVRSFFDVIARELKE